MRILCDANVLLALVYSGHEAHPHALAWFDSLQDDSAVVCRATQTTLLRLLTQGSVMGLHVCTQQRAWEIYDELMSDARFVFEPEPVGLEDIWRVFCSRPIVAPRLWADAYLAAFAAAGGMLLVTFDHGFRQFVGLFVRVLGQPAVHEEASDYMVAESLAIPQD